MMNQYLYILKDLPAQWHGYWGNMGPGAMNWGYGTNWLGTLIWLAILIAVVVSIIALVRWMTISGRSSSSRPHHTSDSAMEILRRRYAQGEITKEQFTAMKHDLEE